MAARRMRALAATGDAGLIGFARVPVPVPKEGEALVEVRAVSLNRGELHRLETAQPAWRPGWDFAGVVSEVPTSGGARDLPGTVSGGPGPEEAPAPGTRVFGMASQAAWAEEMAVPIGSLAPIPDGLSFEEAAALPVAGLSALRMLRLYGDLSGRRVRVTGAAGGVGRYAVQLAHRAGASVTAVVGRPERERGLLELGAGEIVGVDDTGEEPEFDLILESVGGGSLRDALMMCAPGGLVVSFGNSSRSPTGFSVSDFYPKQARLVGFYLLTDMIDHPVGADLALLGDLVAKRSLHVEIAEVHDWSDASELLALLKARKLAGKAVLRVGREGTSA
jgi:NADPH2:quinone reductase